MHFITLRACGFAVSVSGIATATLLQLHLIEFPAVTAVFIGHLTAALACIGYAKHYRDLPARK